MNPAETNRENAQLLKMLELLRPAAIRGDTGVSEELQKLSERNDSVGSSALEIHGEVLCSSGSARPNPELGTEKLRKSALFGNERAFDALLDFERNAKTASANLGKDLRRRWKETARKTGCWNYWEPIFKQRLNDAGDAQMAKRIAQRLAKAGWMDESGARRMLALMASMETDGGIDEKKRIGIRLSRAELLCDSDFPGRDFGQAADLLLQLASSGSREARDYLLSHVNGKAAAAFFAVSKTLAENTGDGDLFYALGKSPAKPEGEPACSLFQTGAFLGSAKCALKLLFIRLSEPQADLEEIDRELSSLADSELDPEGKILKASVAGALCKRCQDALFVDNQVLSVCQRFHDRPEALTVIDRHRRMTALVTKYESKPCT